MMIKALTLAAMLPVASAKLGAAPIKAEVKDAKDSAGYLYGELYGYVSANSGLAGASCSYSYSCTLDSFQQYATPVTNLITYGKRIVYQPSSYYYGKSEFVSLSKTLQNETSRIVDFKADCGVPVVPSYSSSYAYGTFITAPRMKFELNEHGNGTLKPEVEPLVVQAIAFNNSDNYTEPNSTYFRVFDIDMSQKGNCVAKDRSPDLDMQRQLNLGTGYMRCAVRRDDIDSNVTGVVRSTHYAVVQHDYSSGNCRGTSASGYTKSCVRVVRFNSYSNGTLGAIKSFDVTNWPDDVDFAGSQTCFLEPNSRKIVILGKAYSTYASTLMTLSNIDSSYSSPTATLVRTLPSSVTPSTSTFMNVENNAGFISGQYLLTYSVDGDLQNNLSLATITGSSYQGMSYTAYAERTL